MKNFIATWICLDTHEDGTYFPSAKGKSSDKKVQDIYWRCLCCFFTTARWHNPGAELILFCNVHHLPNVEGVDIHGVLKRLNVRLQFAALEYKTPTGYYNQWRNQFYEFSIFKTISQHTDFNPTDRFLLLDSDCIITSDLSSLFEDITNHQCITYHINYEPGHVINGLSRKDMQVIFKELLSEEIPDYPVYHGGEVYASTVQVVRDLMDDFYSLWEQLLERHSRQLPKLNEEAHVLSFLFYKNRFAGGQANRYIKRLWTDPASFRNVEAKDKQLAIWHLPAEKRKGFRQFFMYLKRHDFNLSGGDRLSYQRRLERTFLVPSIPLHRQPYYLGKTFLKKMLSSS